MGPDRRSRTPPSLDRDLLTVQKKILGQDEAS
jgi:hypothetical protein